MGDDANAVEAGQIWRNRHDGAFYLVTSADSFLANMHRITLNPTHGFWQPCEQSVATDTRTEWLTTYCQRYDRVERWLTDGPLLVSIDPNRHFDLERRALTVPSATAGRQPAVIFDVDGTLCDVRSVRHLIDEKGFDAFHRASGGCPPHDHVVEAAHAAAAAGHAVLVVTGRSEKWRSLTSMWLALHAVPSDVLRMRPDRDYRKDYVIKRAILARLRSRYDIVHAWDDHPAVLRLWEEEGIPTTVVPGWDGPA